MTFTLDAAARAKRGLVDFAVAHRPLAGQAQGAAEPHQRRGRDRSHRRRHRQSLARRLQAGRKAGQGDVSRQTRRRRAALAQRIAVDFGAAMMRGSADTRHRRRRAEREDHPGAHLAKRRFQGRRRQQRQCCSRRPCAARRSTRGRSSNRSTEQASPAQAGGKDFDVDMKVATALGANRQSISGLELDFLSSRGGDDRGSAQLRGRDRRRRLVSASRRRAG